MNQSDGLKYICYCCNEFVHPIPKGFTTEDGNWINQGLISPCCNTEVFYYTEDEIEDFKDFLSDADEFDLQDRELALFNALKQEEDLDLYS